MPSTFFGLNIATQGLHSSRMGLNVSFNNLSNMETRGYSKQVIQQRATTPIALKNGKGMLGTGSEVYNVIQLRDFYLDKKFWSQSSVLGENSAKNEALAQIEGVFDSQSDKGFTTVLNDFFDSAQDLMQNSGDDTNLTIIRQKASTFTQYFNDMSQKLKTQQESLNFNVRATVDQINSLAVQIQSLNRQIYKSEIDGSHANTLRDARAVLVDDLSELVNVDVSEDENGHFRVDLNGQNFIDHLNVRTLELRERKLPEEDVMKDNASFVKYLTDNGLQDNYDLSSQEKIKESLESFKQDYKKYQQTNTSGLFDIYWSGSNNKLQTSNYNFSGKLKGYLDMRDGNNNFVGVENGGLSESINYKGIPYYMDELNQFARTFAKLMNEGVSYNGTKLSEKGGFANGYGKNDKTGLGLFSYSDGNFKPTTGNINPENGDTLDYSQITAGNFSISKEVNEDVKNLATRFEKDGGESDNSLVEAINSLRHDNSAFSQGEIGDYMTSLFTEVAVNKKQADTFEKAQDSVLLSVENQRLSVSGVSTNEETALWLKYQQVYTACCKMITVMDEIYNTTINKLGAT